MSLADAETEANFNAFTASWREKLPLSIAALGAHRNVFLGSYSRIAAFNAWKCNVMDRKASSDSLKFFVEAINDALVSHVFAGFGSWRVSLMSLRSCIENTYNFLYYMDHPIELRLWELGEHRLGFSDVHLYLERHPDIAPFHKSTISGLPTLKAEYGTLSRAVHASASGFRMSPDGKTVSLWRPEAASLNQWNTREKHTFGSLNLLLTSVFRESLQGTQNLPLRQALARVIPDSLRARLKSDYKVTIPIL